MSSTITDVPNHEEPVKDWILALDNVLKLTDEKTKTGLQARITCNVVNDNASFILPPEMAELQPDVLNYLHAIGAAHDITLIEERRSKDRIPVINRRSQRPTNLALGISLLLKQTGMPGPVHSLSVPHMLKPGNDGIDIAKLIKIVAKVYPDSKRVIFEPNRFLTGEFTDQNASMTGYACKVMTNDNAIILGYFNAPQFHAIGYVTNDQFVMHVFLAGGPIRQPRLWSPYKTMTDSIFRCQLFKSALAGSDFGLLYTTFYIDLEGALQNRPSWHESKINPRH